MCKRSQWNTDIKKDPEDEKESISLPQNILYAVKQRLLENNSNSNLETTIANIIFDWLKEPEQCDWMQPRFSVSKPENMVQRKFEEELFSKVCGFKEFYDDMLFLEGSTTYGFVDGKDEHSPLHVLWRFDYDFFLYEVAAYQNMETAGSFDWLSYTLYIAPQDLHNDPVILHEMIHLHEFALEKLPKHYRDTVLYCLYKDLSAKIENLDELLMKYGHAARLDAISNKGGEHSLLFILKSFDLDRRYSRRIGKPVQFGTVLGYENIPSHNPAKVAEE